jgi:hypothetical protein
MVFSAVLLRGRLADLPWLGVVIVIVAIGTALPAYAYKKVELEGDDLVISNFGREVRVPLTEIRNVSGGNRGRGPIRIDFRNETAFGLSIRFLPVPMGFATPHPFVTELLQRSGLE